jgi:hypothetical protein
MSWLDLSNVKEDMNFEILPVGSYVVTCENAELKENKAGDGSYISCTFKIIEGNYEGRKVFHHFNIKNKSVKCVEIGLGQLKTFLRLSGKDPNSLDGPHYLEGCVAVAVVKHQAAKDGYDAKAVVSYFKPHENGANLSTGFKADDSIPF